MSESVGQDDGSYKGERSNNIKIRIVSIFSNRLLCFPRITAIIDAQNNDGGKQSAAEVNR